MKKFLVPVVAFVLVVFGATVVFAGGGFSGAASAPVKIFSNEPIHVSMIGASQSTDDTNTREGAPAYLLNPGASLLLTYKVANGATDVDYVVALSATVSASGDNPSIEIRQGEGDASPLPFYYGEKDAAKAKAFIKRNGSVMVVVVVSYPKDAVAGSVASVSLNAMRTNCDTLDCSVPTPSPTPVPTPVSSGSLTIAVNATVGNSTVTVGQKDVLLGSYVVQTDCVEPVGVTADVSGIIGGSASLNALSNIRLIRADTKSLLGSDVVPVGQHLTSGKLEVEACQTIQINLLADVSSQATDGGTDDFYLTLFSVKGVGKLSGASILPGTAVRGQSITVVQKGTLTVSIDTAGAASSQIYVSGQQDVEMLRVKLSATVEDVKVRQIVFGTINGSGNIARVKLLGTGLSVDPSASLLAGQAVFNFAPGNEIAVPAYGTRVVTVVVDITDVGTIIAGQMVSMGFVDVEVVGASSGLDIQEETEGPLKGNPMRMEEVEPCISLAPESPSGSQMPGPDQIVAVFNVTACGYRDLTFNSLILEKMGNNNPEKNIRAFRLYSQGTLLAKVTDTGVGSAVPFTYAPPLGADVPLVEQYITAGQTRTLIVRADTTHMKDGASDGKPVTFSLRIPGTPGPLGEGGFSWDYTPLSNEGTATYKTQTDSYPVQGGVLEY